MNIERKMLIKLYYFLLLIISILLIQSCSSIDNNVSEVSDPFEKQNRKVFKFNQGFDKYVLSPASNIYKKTLHRNIRKGVSNYTEWVSTPGTIINSGLQFEGENLALSTIKFLLNSMTLGFYDLDDGETKFKKIDFGSTLAKYNFSEGPYLVVPFLGPRTTRHFSGNIINYTTANDGLKDEISYLKKYEIPVNAIDKRTKFSNIIDDINSSPDPYAKLRSYYIQNRRKNLLVGEDYENKLIEKEEEEFEKLLD